MGTTINFHAHKPFYSRPKIQTVSHVHILAFPLSNINGSHSVTVKLLRRSKYAVSENMNTRSIASILDDWLCFE